MKSTAALLVLASVCSAGLAQADPYRLRSDAFVDGSASPVGLIVLQGEQRVPSYVDAEAMVWAGTGERPGDAMVVAVRLRDASGYGEARVGRFVLATGAVRPLHLDGAHLVGHAPFGTSLEVFGGVPVVPGFGPRAYDWVVGQRLSQRFSEVTTFGVSYMHQRDRGRLAFEEVGLDASVSPVRMFDGAVTVATDLVRPGVSSARASVAARLDGMRIEAFGVRRSPSRLLPATSLFAALGDVPSDRGGLSWSFRAFPRLDLLGEGSIESLGGSFGETALARATLRLDDRGDGAVSIELRRDNVEASAWTGARATLRVPVVTHVAASTEVEVARPDEPRGRGTLWPWGLLALSYTATRTWEAGAAVEAHTSPTERASVAGLVRLSGSWGAP